MSINKDMISKMRWNYISAEEHTYPENLHIITLPLDLPLIGQQLTGEIFYSFQSATYMEAG
jgi:hypothetical protein